MAWVTPLSAPRAAMQPTANTTTAWRHQSLFAMRLIYADSASARPDRAREYFVSNVGATDRGGHDNIFRVDASFTQRIIAAMPSPSSTRKPPRCDLSDLGSRTQSRGTIGIFYTFMGQDGFGKVDWR
ncbi:MAG: hypothetical protein IPP88_18960 [Betaproteobacteria bacterium]|nr:hypothetical protein [Betaproteobacteria bacterium]